MYLKNKIHPLLQLYAYRQVEIMSLSKLIKNANDPMAEIFEFIEESRNKSSRFGLKDAKKHFSDLERKLGDVQGAINSKNFNKAMNHSLSQTVDSIQLSAEGQALYRDLLARERKNSLNDVEQYSLNKMREFSGTQALNSPVNITTASGINISISNAANGKIIATIEENKVKREIEITGNTLITENKSGQLEIREVNGTTIEGTEGDDVLISLYAHKIKGYGGNDTVVSLNNMLQKVDIDTGSGDDSVITSNLWGANINTGTGNDSISTGNVFLSGIDAGAGNDLVQSKNLVRALVDLGSGDNILIGNNASFSTINAGGGNDIIILNDVSSTTINAGDGDNTIKADDITSSEIYTGMGNDFIEAKNIEGSTITSGAGNDNINAFIIKNSEIYTGDGDDTLNTEYIQDKTKIVMGEGNDVLNAKEIIGGTKQEDNVTIDMGSGNDKIYAEKVENTILSYENGNAKITHSLYIDMGAGKNSLSTINASPAETADSESNNNERTNMVTVYGYLPSAVNTDKDTDDVNAAESSLAESNSDTQQSFIILGRFTSSN